MKLSGCRKIGRFRNKITGQTVNIHRGRWMTRGEDLHFFIRSGKRILVGAREFYEDWEKVKG